MDTKPPRDGRSPSSSTLTSDLVVGPIDRPNEVVELTRLWLADGMPKNSESRVISIALRAIKKKPGRFRAVLSYADEQEGHTGTIYQATNWRYMGLSSSNTGTAIVVGDKKYSSRSFNSKYGTHSIEKLKGILGRDDVSYFKTETRKHAYVFPLDAGAEAWCREHQKPYPRGKQAMAGHHPAQRRGSTDRHAPMMTDG